MFGTFAGVNGAEVHESTIEPERPKRAQVARACVWCRLNRVRCDSLPTCRNCVKRQQHCRRDEKPDTLTLPMAQREIKRLRSEIEVLKQAHERETCHQKYRARYEDTVKEPPGPEPTQFSGVFLPGHGPGAVQQYYGFSSLRNLVHKLNVHLRLAYGWVYIEEELHPRPVTLSFATPIASTKSQLATSSSLSDLNCGVFMQQSQEEECVRIFWQSYHCAIPILDERDFQEQHSVLWHQPHPSTQSRADSPLVDIVLAICVQYGMTHVQRNAGSPETEDNAEATDPSNAGRWYFQRCQSLLRTELESVSIKLLQCQILSAIYLRDASLQNMALSTIMAAAQTAYALGFHIDNGKCSSRYERELCKRLWCMVFVLDGKMNMDYGRPFFVKNTDVRLPGDDHELASISTQMFVPFVELNITWLTYHVQHVKLVRVARDVFSKFYGHHGRLLASSSVKDFAQDSKFVNDCDNFLTRELIHMRSWLGCLPKSLQCDISTTSTLSGLENIFVDIDGQVPLWLQMQRVMLRLLYHDTMINLCRPFIVFPFQTSPDVLGVATNAVECLRHSISITEIIHQVLRQSEILHGWHRAYQFQWNAAISMVAFSFSRPTSTFEPLVLVEIEKSITVLDKFGRSFAIARSASNIIRELVSRLQQVHAKRLLEDSAVISTQL